MCAKKRTKIKGVDVKTINVPFFEKLAIKDLLEFAAKYEGVMRCFPEVEKETLKMPREYIGNVIYTKVSKLAFIIDDMLLAFDGPNVNSMPWYLYIATH